jgi:glutathione S-transferase
MTSDGCWPFQDVRVWSNVGFAPRAALPAESHFNPRQTLERKFSKRSRFPNWVLPRLDSEIALQLGYLNNALEGRPCILGDELSAADMQLSFFGELGRSAVSYLNIEAWVKKFQARPAYKAALTRCGAYTGGA